MQFLARSDCVRNTDVVTAFVLPLSFYFAENESTQLHPVVEQNRTDTGAIW